jgi:hypothetical protein
MIYLDTSIAVALFIPVGKTANGKERFAMCSGQAGRSLQPVPQVWRLAEDTAGLAIGRKTLLTGPTPSPARENDLSDMNHDDHPL